LSHLAVLLTAPAGRPVRLSEALAAAVRVALDDLDRAVAALAASGEGVT
jgi:hypothetical protein